MPSLRPVARPLAAIVVLHLALLLAWSVVVPTFRGADEHVHHDLVRYLTTTWDYPEYDELAVSARTLAALGDSPVYPADAPAAPASAAADRDVRTSWSGLGPDDRIEPPNQLVMHPPLYYGSAAALVRIVDADDQAPLDRVVWQLRLLSVLTLLPVPLLAADIAARFTASKAVVLTAAAATLAVPQLTHVGATVSNDPLMILLGSVALAGTARLLTGDRRWVVAVVTGAAAGLAMFTKGFAVPLVPAVALACLHPLWVALMPPKGEERNPERGSEAGREAVGRTLALSGTVAALSLALGGWWWVRNVVVYRNPQPGVRLRDRVVDVDVDPAEFAGSFGERLVDSFWGNFGWREVSLPLALSIALTVVAVVAVGAACWRRWDRLILAIPAAMALAMVLAAGWGAYRKTGVSYATQGRYLFTGIAALAALAALGLARLAGGRTRWLATSVLAAALGLQAVSLGLALDRYWAGPGLDRLRALGRFAPIPGPVTVAIGISLAVSAVAALWAVVGATAGDHTGGGAGGRSGTLTGDRAAGNPREPARPGRPVRVP